MSRFTGPQHRGAARALADDRRREAEARQRQERKREAKRRAELAAAPPLRPLTDEQLAELLYAAAKVELAQRLNELGVPWPIAEQRAREIRA